METVFAIALGAALGGGLRHQVTTRVEQRFGKRLPWGTVIVNLSGCLAGGGLAAATVTLSGQAGPGVTALAVGLLGSYTTVSSFSLQAVDLFRAERRSAALGYVLASLMGGVLAAASGWQLVRALTGGD